MGSVLSKFMVKHLVYDSQVQSKLCKGTMHSLIFMQTLMLRLLKGYLVANVNFIGLEYYRNLYNHCCLLPRKLTSRVRLYRGTGESCIHLTHI